MVEALNTCNGRRVRPEDGARRPRRPASWLRRNDGPAGNVGYGWAVPQGARPRQPRLRDGETAQAASNRRKATARYGNARPGWRVPGRGGVKLGCRGGVRIDVIGRSILMRVGTKNSSAAFVAAGVSFPGNLFRRKELSRVECTGAFVRICTLQKGGGCITFLGRSLDIGREHNQPRLGN
jgi:hypothetical protein